MTILRFVPAMYGLSEGGVPEGSPEAKAAIRRVAEIMKPRKRTTRKDEPVNTVTPPVTDMPILEEEWSDGEMTARGTVMHDRSGYLTVENDTGTLDPRTRKMTRDDWLRLISLGERAVAAIDRLEIAA